MMGSLVVVFIVQVDDFDVCPVDPECQPPIFDDEQAPNTFAVTGQLMRFPAWNDPKLAFVFHVLQKGDDAAELLDNGWLDARSIVMLNEPSQAFVENVPNSHRQKPYDLKRIASSDRLHILG
jgi:hypothetical protein